MNLVDEAKERLFRDLDSEVVKKLPAAPVKWCCEPSIEEKEYGHGELNRPWPVKVVGKKWYNFDVSTGEIDDDDNASGYINDDTAIFDTKEQALQFYKEWLESEVKTALDEIAWCEKDGLDYVAQIETSRPYVPGP